MRLESFPVNVCEPSNGALIQWFKIWINWLDCDVLMLNMGLGMKIMYKSLIMKYEYNDVRFW